MTAAEELRQDDPDVAAARQLFAAWRGVFGDRRVSAAEVVAKRAWPRAASAKHPRSTPLCNWSAAKSRTARRLGYWCRSHRGRIVDGLRLESAGIDPHSKVALWRVACG
jgi:hypothetical protein